MLTKCDVCGSYDVVFYETLTGQYYCDSCFREQEWHEMCIETKFDTGQDTWCGNGYWLEPQR